MYRMPSCQPNLLCKVCYSVFDIGRFVFELILHGLELSDNNAKYTLFQFKWFRLNHCNNISDWKWSLFSAGQFGVDAIWGNVQLFRIHSIQLFLSYESKTEKKKKTKIVPKTKPIPKESKCKEKQKSIAEWMLIKTQATMKN